MNETQAVVRALENGDTALVEAVGGGCGHCHESGGCGASSAKMFCSSPRVFRVRNGVGAQVGQTVTIGLAEGVLLKSVALLYLLPLLCIFAGAALGQGLAPETLQEWGGVGGAIVGGLLGFVVAKRWQHRLVHRPEAMPVILGLLS